VTDPTPGDDAPQAPKAVRYRDAPKSRRRRLWIILPIVLVVVVATLLVVVGIAGRAVAERYIAERVEQSLPPGVEADVSVRLPGAFLVAQYLRGRMDEVDLASNDLTVQGIGAKARVRLEGVPTDLEQPVERATGSVVLDETALQAMVAQQGYSGSVKLNDGSVEYSDTTKLFGANVDYIITARPSVEAGRLDLTPESARVSSGGIDVDASALLARVAPDGLSICLAEYLPESIAVDSLLVGDGTAKVGLSGSQVVLTEEALSRTGTCS
jgi:hypothetical protein